MVAAGALAAVGAAEDDCPGGATVWGAHAAQCYVRSNGTAIVVCTAVTAPKVKALRERPNVALTIDTIGPPAKALLVRGLAHVEIVDGVAPEYLAAAAKSTHGDELAAFEAQVRATYKRMARITIAPTWARFYDFGAGRFPTFLRRLVDSTSV